MGAWDNGPFSNDTASDWLADVRELPADERAEAVRRALSAAIDADYLDTPEGEEAVAAATLVARHCPGGDSLPPEPATETVVALDDDLAELRPLARRAIAAVRGEQSELAELWADDLEAWSQTLDDADRVLAG